MLAQIISFILVFVQRCIEIVVDVVFWKTCFDEEWRRSFEIHINKLILKFVAFTKLVITLDLSNACVLQQIKINRIRFLKNNQACIYDQLYENIWLMSINLTKIFIERVALKSLSKVDRHWEDNLKYFLHLRNFMT